MFILFYFFICLRKENVKKIQISNLRFNMRDLYRHKLYAFHVLKKGPKILLNQNVTLIRSIVQNCVMRLVL
jgi:hypothetical protein